MAGSALAEPVQRTNVRPTVQVAMEFIEVPSGEVTRLLSVERLGRDGEKLRSELQMLIEQGKAAQTESMLVSSVSGQEATSESALEVISPVEWEPPGLPGTFLPGPTHRDPKPDPLLPYPPVPTAFSTRAQGNTLKFESSVGKDSRRVNLILSPEIVFDAGTGRWPLRKGDPPLVEPYFYSLRTHSSITCSDGVPSLLGILTPMTKAGTTSREQKLLVIVTADIVSLGVPLK